MDLSSHQCVSYWELQQLHNKDQGQDHLSCSVSHMIIQNLISFCFPFCSLGSICFTSLVFLFYYFFTLSAPFPGCYYASDVVNLVGTVAMGTGLLYISLRYPPVCVCLSSWNQIIPVLCGLRARGVYRWTWPGGRWVEGLTNVAWEVWIKGAAVCST